MRRSEINRAIDDALRFFTSRDYPLPGYSRWSPREWAAAGPEYDEIRDLGLGWDVTDFGSGDFANVGRTIFTLRNGSHSNPRYPKRYAQKVMHMPEGQKSIIHHHRSKMEDICNQGPGNILIRFWGVAADKGPGDDLLTLSLSGRRIVQPAGEPLRIDPCESVCVPHMTYHQFWAAEGCGEVLSMEVSSVCDDRTDNYFLDSGERFPAIEEDEAPRYVLCSDLDQYRTHPESGGQ